MTLEIRHLRQLLAIAEHGTFGRAAAALGMTQPALSRSVQALEAEVGTLLFDRSKAGAHPTDEGRLLIRGAGQLVAAADELDREVSRRRQAHGASHVVAGAGPYPADTLMPLALTRFMVANPFVRVRMVVREWDELLARLRSREIDFFVAETSTLADEHDLAVQPLQPVDVYFIGRRGHRLGGRASVSPARALVYPCLAVSRIPPRILDPMLAGLRDAQVQQAGRPFPALENATLGAAKAIVRRSDAITVLPLAAAADELEQGSLIVLGREPWMSLQYGIVTLKDSAPSAAAARLQECILAEESVLAQTAAQLERRLPTRHPPRPRKKGKGGAAGAASSLSA